MATATATINLVGNFQSTNSGQIKLPEVDYKFAFWNANRGVKVLYKNKELDFHCSSSEKTPQGVMYSVWTTNVDPCYFKNKKKSAMLTSTKAFKEAAHTSEDGRHLLSFENFIKFLPQMRGEWLVDVGLTYPDDDNIPQYSGELRLGTSISWQEICQGYWLDGKQKHEFCYLRAVSSNRECIICQIVG